MLNDDVVGHITTYIVALNRGSIWKPWIMCCKTTYRSSMGWPDMCTKLANTAETVYKMGLITLDVLIVVRDCPVKYLSYINQNQRCYSYENITIIKNNVKNRRGRAVDWRTLSFNTPAKIILANIKKPWVIDACGGNKSFSFENYEYLCKFRGKLSYIKYFHSITIDIYAKYFSHLKHYDLRNMTVDIMLAYPDRYNIKDIQYCRDFNIDHLIEHARVFNDIIIANVLYTLDRVWEHYQITEENAYYYSCNTHITLDVFQKNEILTMYSRSIMRHASLELAEYIIQLPLKKNERQYTAIDLLNNKNITWKFLEEWNHLLGDSVEMIDE